MRTVCIFLVLLAAACAALPLETDPWKHWGVREPEYLIMHFPLGMVADLCGIKAAEGETILGCAIPEVSPCQIIMAHPGWYGPGWYQLVLDHEKAHCRGWGHEDPQPEGTT